MWRHASWGRGVKYAVTVLFPALFVLQIGTGLLVVTSDGSLRSGSQLGLSPEPETRAAIAETTPTATSPSTAPASSAPTVGMVTKSAWSGYHDPELGISLRYPPGWTVTGSSGGGSITLTSWEPAEVGHGGLSSGMAKIDIMLDTGSIRLDGQPFSVGIDSYQGIISAGDPSGPVNPDRVIRITYDATGQRWMIAGYFGDPATDTNPLTETFYGIVKTIRHSVITASARSVSPFSSGPVIRYKWVNTWSGFVSPQGLTVDSIGNVYVADSGNNTVAKLSPIGEAIYALAYSPEGFPLRVPTDVTPLEINDQGLVYIADMGNHQIEFFHTSGGPGASWTADADFFYPHGVVLNSIGTVFVTSGHSLFQFTPAGEYRDHIALNGDLWGIALDSTGMIYIADFGGSRILKLTSDGMAVTNEWIGFDHPTDVAVDPEGNIFVADSGNNRIVKLSPTGLPLAEWSDVGDNGGHLDRPRGVAVDAKGMVYVTDLGGHIHIFAPVN